MNLANKKYFSISEVSEITGLPIHKLRYLEKSKTEMHIFQIRGRRYYTAADIESIKQNSKQGDELIQLNLFTNQNANKETASNFSLHLNSNIIIRIDSLISKFIGLEKDIISQH